MAQLQTKKAWHSCEDHDYRSCNQGVNCYSYILDEPSYRWSVPGHGYFVGLAQDYFNKFDAYFTIYNTKEFQDSIKQGAIKDGLLAVDEPTFREGYCIAALFFANKSNDHDFHWLKLGEDRLWSHKNGWHSISKVDENGDDIIDPLTMKNLQYPVFGGYYLVPNSGLALKESFPS